MNNWKESGWFKTWLNLAREGQNGSNAAEAQWCDMTPADRLNLKTAGTVESVPASEWQVAE